MALRIRPMTHDDKPGIMRILRATPEFLPPEVVIAEEVIDSYLQDPLGSGYNILVAEVDTAVAGYICYGPTPLTEGTWDIYWIAVSQPQQNHGIGSALLAFAENEIRTAKGRLMLIETSSKPAYEKTRRFYLHQDYEVICCISDFYAPKDDKIILRKLIQTKIIGDE